MHISDHIGHFYRNAGAPPPGYIEDFVDFTQTLTNADVSSNRLSLITGTEYIIKEVRVYVPTPQADCSSNLNTAATDVAATRFGPITYNAGSFVIFSGNRNGRINAVLSAAPYIHSCAGTGAATTQTLRGTCHYYYK